MASEFLKQIYDLVAQIPPGQVAYYGQLALLCGRPRASRIVGAAMASAPPGLPCHRVVHKDGSLCHTDAFGGAGIQRQMLEQEGVTFTGEGCVQMKLHLFSPKF